MSVFVAKWRYRVPKVMEISSGVLKMLAVERCDPVVRQSCIEFKIYSYKSDARCVP